MRILIADDNEINRQFICAVLEGEPCQIDQACSGREAVAMAVQHRYDVILMDIRMPEVDGIEATRQILMLPAYHTEQPRIVALTADLQLRQQTDLQQLGFDTCLDKPVSRQTLLDVLHRKTSAQPSHEHADDLPINHAVALAAAGGSRVLVDKLTAMLAKEIDQFQPRIIDAIQQQDWSSAQDMVHKLCGSAGYCGAQPLQQAAIALEQALKSGQSSEITTTQRPFFDRLDELKTYLGAAHLTSPE